MFDITVFTAQSSQNKESNLRAKEPIKQIFYKQIEKKDTYALLKNVRF